jgi:hypothetical protein
MQTRERGGTVTVILDRLQDFATWAAGGKIPLPEIFSVPSKRCLPVGTVGADIEPDDSYVTIDVNELFLSKSRQLWVVNNPMVVVTTSFIYGGTYVSVPAIVGPDRLAKLGEQAPRGTVIHDTTVAGPYPYRGGSVAISVVLYRVPQGNYLDDMLQMVEGISSAMGASTDFGMLGKLGPSLLKGLEKLCGVGGAIPIAGHRIELSPTKPSGFRTCFAALITNTKDLATQDLWVDKARLRVTDSKGNLVPFEDADFVLYSVNATPRRDDISTLPFFTLFERAKVSASRRGEESWASAKATFGELLQQLTASADLTDQQARELKQKFRDVLLSEHKIALETEIMSAGPTTPRLHDAQAVGEIASLLQL